MSKEILAESSISLNSLVEYSHVDTGTTAPTDPAEGDVWYETDDDGNTKSIKQYSVTEDKYIQQTESSTYDSSATYYTKGEDGTYSAVTITEKEFDADKTQYYILESGTASWTSIPLTGSVLANNTITNTQLTEKCVRVPNLAIGQYMNFYDAPMIIMGGQDSTKYKLAISEKELAFYYGAAESEIVNGTADNKYKVAYIDADQLYISKAVVVTGMQIADYIWNTRKITVNKYIHQTSKSVYDSEKTYYVQNSDGTYSAVTITEEEFDADKTKYYTFKPEMNILELKYTGEE